MEALILHTGIAAPLLRDNVDTDAIIPSREMKRVSKRGLSEGLFAGWRYTLPGSREPDPDFILNRAPYHGASILLAGRNFGCGSSREHAAWALREYGIRVIIARSFGSIFQGNCVRNGILPLVLDRQQIGQLAGRVAADPQHHQVEVDLPRQLVRCVAGGPERRFDFEISAGAKAMLLEGLDAIDLTLRQADAIAGFERDDARQRPWVYLQRKPAK
jgi:3-isopropylmalate/(R)-2-methylmalate dehydratase small subunit